MFAMDTGPGACLEHFKWGGQSGALAQKRALWFAARCMLKYIVYTLTKQRVTAFLVVMSTLCKLSSL